MKRIVDTAAQQKLAAHIWMHPSLSDKQMTMVLAPLLRYCADQRDKGLIEVLTMEHWCPRLVKPVDCRLALKPFQPNILLEQPAPMSRSKADTSMNVDTESVR